MKTIVKILLAASLVVGVITLWLIKPSVRYLPASSLDIPPLQGAWDLVFVDNDRRGLNFATIEGGSGISDPKKIWETDNSVYWPDISPDGKKLFFTVVDEAEYDPLSTQERGIPTAFVYWGPLNGPFNLVYTFEGYGSASVSSYQFDNSCWLPDSASLRLINTNSRYFVYDIDTDQITNYDDPKTVPECPRENRSIADGGKLFRNSDQILSPSGRFSASAIWECAGSAFTQKVFASPPILSCSGKSLLLVEETNSNMTYKIAEEYFGNLNWLNDHFFLIEKDSTREKDKEFLPARPDPKSDIALFDISGVIHASTAGQMYDVSTVAD
jgi:hypothetical protein